MSREPIECTHCVGEGRVCPDCEETEDVCECETIKGFRYCPRCDGTGKEPSTESAGESGLVLHDPINSPTHYKSESGLEAIDVIKAFRLGFCLGNVAKYILRAGKKGDRLEDLKKARWYLNREISETEAEAAKEASVGSPTDPG